MSIFKIHTLFFLILFICSCTDLVVENNTDDNRVKRTFETSFESVDDFKDFYIVPQNYKNSSSHELSDSIVHSGTYSHKAWAYDINEPSTALINNNHRAYPTIQLYKTQGGSFTTPCRITFWVWMDMVLKESSVGDNDWLSLATFCDDESDNWRRTVLVNVSHEGIVHLMHVPHQGEQRYLFQTDSITLPQKEWVKIEVYLDFREDAYAKVWQNGALVSHADIESISNKLAQAHFGLYSPPQVSSGVIYNDDLKIEMAE